MTKKRLYYYRYGLVSGDTGIRREKRQGDGAVRHRAYFTRVFH